jgi:hypothetical protein
MFGRIVSNFPSQVAELISANSVIQTLDLSGTPIAYSAICSAFLFAISRCICTWSNFFFFFLLSDLSLGNDANRIAEALCRNSTMTTINLVGMENVRCYRYDSLITRKPI